MINLNNRIGPLKLRAWGLILNLIANIMALYGVVGIIKKVNLPVMWTLFITGGLITLICLVVLSIPNQYKHEK